MGLSDKHFEPLTLPNEHLESFGFSDDYFELYRGDPEQPVRYGEHWDPHSLIDDTDHQLMAAIQKVFSDKGEMVDINSVLDVGCANGGKMQKLYENYGLEVFGIENAAWAQRNVIPGYKDRIIFDDCRKHFHRFDTDSFDFVLECSAKYLPKEHVRMCMEECFRIARKVVVSTVASTNNASNDEIIDTYQTVHRSTEWWMKLLRSIDECRFAEMNGFYLVAGVDSL